MVPAYFALGTIEYSVACPLDTALRQELTIVWVFERKVSLFNTCPDTVTGWQWGNSNKKL